MPSRPHDTGWDFSRVLNLIDSESQDVGSTTLLPRTQTDASLPDDAKTQIPKGKRLGSFTKLWEQLGVPDDVPLPAISPLEPESEDQTDSDNALLPPDDLDDNGADTDRSLDAGLTSFSKDVPTEDPFAGMNKKQRAKARKRAEKERQTSMLLYQKYRQSEREREDLQGRLDSTLMNQRRRNQSIALTEKQEQVQAQSLSNVGAKMRPFTPSPIHSPMPVQRSVFVQKSVPGPVASNAPLKPTSASQPKDLSPVKGPQVRAQLTTVGTPVRQHNQFPFPQHPLITTGLVPRTVQPVLVPRMVFQPALDTPQMLQPPMTPGMTHQPSIIISREPKVLHIRSRVDRHFQFLHHLMREFPEDVPWLLSPMQLCNEKSSTVGIHVFVDSSNIMIGFNDTLRGYRTHGFHLSFDSLVLLMERRRPVAKRVYAGSHRESAPLPHVTKLVEMSKAIGYENLVKEQVLIRREDSEKKKFFKSVKKMGWTKAAQLHSGSVDGDSDPEMETVPATPSAPKWVEQGVDEILHLKMCQSIIDTEVPTTMVLATGDGAEAEHSDGFLAHVERALRKGWKVELVCWKQQTNGGYKSKRFRDKWGEQFKILYLDGYIESLIDTE
ncbi:hypothetical protein K505DRAFT_263517 [Melanomma pulvis-pyrius CBS 109.77]|uniref:NYN domain-containing protein n=1 Tax=Melanomma pulvis-pyrius CBS 109.77 TaxID=1314802 RepID=A0A6A6XXU6_9PLEO|nr:hypothetical protein K505DRAFT_263517 [Melanomma pulvis-pyrius CBS 109.77]